MTVINSATRNTLSTVSEHSQVHAAAITANSTDVDNTVNRLAESRGALNSPREDGENTLKSINIEQANMDVSLSQTELIVYDGELSSNNIELQGVRAQLYSKMSSLATEEAKTEIRTSINDDGNAEFITHSGMKIVTDTNKGGHETWIYNPAGEQLMHIHGDPHVNMLKDADGNNGDDFHFGDDSTLKFEDGTELTFNTTELGKDTGIFYTTGIYVRAGDNVMHTGEATSGGERRADIAKVDADSYSRTGSTAKGAVTMGLKGDGQILMQTGNQWNELKDESWDGYLKDKTFDDQKGAAVDFKPQTIGGNKPGKSETITKLESKEAALKSRIPALTQLKSRAESNLDTAMSDLARFSSMDDSEFVDNEESRQDVEQKSLDLSKRANNLGVFMSKSSLVGAGDVAESGIDQADMIADEVAADRELSGNEFDYRDKGLEHSAARNDGTAGLIDNLAALAEVGSFEEKSLENDELPEKSFTEGMTNFNDKFNGLSDALARGTISINAAKNQLNIQAQDLLDNTDTITMNYKDFILDGEQASEDAAKNPALFFAKMNFLQDLNMDMLGDLENMKAQSLANNNIDGGSLSVSSLSNEITTTRNLFILQNSADSLMGQLVDKVQIDFGDISKEEAQGIYDKTLKFLPSGMSKGALETEVRLSGHVLKELERQFGCENSTDNYVQFKDGGVMNVENGLIVSGYYANGTEFTRFHMLDNQNYNEYTSSGLLTFVDNGQVTTTFDDNNRNIGERNLKYSHDIDLTIVDPDGSKFNKLMGAMNMKDIGGTVDYYNGDAKSMLQQGAKLADPMKEKIVENFLAIFGRDTEFIDWIATHGFNIALVDGITGKNPYGEHFGIGGFYKGDDRLIVIDRDDLTQDMLVHEFAHARDHLVDGSLDGVFSGLNGTDLRSSLDVARDRIINHGAGEGLFHSEYAVTNDLELLAELMNGYASDPDLFKERFPEFANALGKTFGHLDDVLALQRDAMIKNEFDGFYAIRGRLGGRLA